MAHARQSRPDSGLGLQVKVVKTLQVVPYSLGSDAGRGLGTDGGPPGPALPSIEPDTIVTPLSLSLSLFIYLSVCLTFAQTLFLGLSLGHFPSCSFCPAHSLLTSLFLPLSLSRSMWDLAPSPLSIARWRCCRTTQTRAWRLSHSLNLNLHVSVSVSLSLFLSLHVYVYRYVHMYTYMHMHTYIFKTNI
jgi:hypothetical protein